MYKWEENHERRIDEDIEEYVCEYYGVTEVFDLTSEQIREIEKFVEEMNEYSVMHSGFHRLLHNWEDGQID